MKKNKNEVNYFKVTIGVIIKSIIMIIFFALALLYNQGIEGVKLFFLSAENRAYFLYVSLIFVFIFALCSIYFIYEDKEMEIKTSNSIMIFLIILISVVACFFIAKFNVYARPFALCAVLTLFLTDRRTAIFLNTITCLILFIVDTFTTAEFSVNYSEYVSLISGVATGMLTAFLLDKQSSRAKCVMVGIIISIPAIFCGTALEIHDNEHLITTVMLPAFASGVLAVAIALILLPIFELIFKVLTNFRMAELADHNSPLIKRLSIEAPGTFNHTLIVASLAEACANAIGENPLLARICAYYHDVGKLHKPQMFTENQTGENPHDELIPELSAEIIRSHAKDGADIIKHYNLPDVLADTALQHHGTTLVKYFYARAKSFTDGELDQTPFRYSGPKPQTKINAIIMISDAAEAKSRSLQVRTHENVDKVVAEIIEERMDDDQFTECDITLKELDTIRNALTNAIAGVYHARVKYPKLKTGGKNGKS